MYDLVIITHIPAFYKVNLYNEISKKLNIYVIFLGSTTNEKRASDFSTLQNATFDFSTLYQGPFQERRLIKSLIKLYTILQPLTYDKIIVGGWELIESWFLIFTNNKSKNAQALESSINDSTTVGLKGFLKKLFVSRLSTVYASGNLHRKLLLALNYKQQIIITQGVGIINKPTLTPFKKFYSKKYIFIGRLSNEKNILLLINIFKELPDCHLTVIGTGPLEKEILQKITNNIILIGAVKNMNIKQYLLASDIFILPSRSEPWGLVVEEALYFGLPVIVSQECGASELISNDENGYVINIDEQSNLKKIIQSIDLEKYFSLCEGVQKISINKKDEKQINAYLKI